VFSKVKENRALAQNDQKSNSMIIVV